MQRTFRGLWIKRWLALGVVLAATLRAPLARAEGGLVFQPYWTYRTEAPVVDVATGDIDGNGVPEVVAATADGVVSVLENDGDLAWRYEAGFRVGGLVVDDLAGDDRASEIYVYGEYVILLSDSQRPMWVYRNQQEDTGENILMRSAISIDLDGDGRHVIANTGILTYINIDDTRTRASRGVRVERPAVHIWAGDVDGDGRPELAPSLAGSSNVYVVHDDLKPAWTQRIPGEVGLVQGGDVDGDGRAEIVVLSTTWELHLLDSDGSPAWQTESLSAGEDSVAPVPDQLLVQDLDGDGRAEVMVAAPGPPATLRVFDGRGQRLWQHTLETVSTPARLAAGDIDGDGQAEVVVTGEGQEQVYLLNAAGRRLAEYATEKTTGALAYADLNGDGWGEIIVGTTGGVQVFGASHQIIWREVWPARRLAQSIAALYVGDVDGDGRGEVVAGSDDGKVFALTDEGHVLWDQDLSVFVHALSAGDVNGDGRPELVAVTLTVLGGVHSQLHLLDGGQPRWAVPVNGLLNSLAVRDLDGDGRAEIIAGSGVGSRGLVLVVDGAGQVAWQREFDEPVTAVAGDGGQVLAGTRSGRVYRLGAHGTPRGEYTLGAEVLGFGEGLAATADGRVYRLGENGPSLVRELGRAVKRVQLGADWIAALDERQVSLLAGDGSLRQGELDDTGTSLAAGDLNGDGQIEVAASTTHGHVHLFSLALDQPPLLTAPDLAETGTGYAYSVAVNDPEGDAVPIGLEIWDPSGGVWLSQPPQSPGEGLGRARLTWEVTDPFDTWDSGRASRFRFRYESGGAQITTNEIGGPLTIPTTPPALYYGQRVGLAALVLLVPALGLLLYRRGRAYRLSPQGQAEATLRGLRASPGRAVPRLHALARSDSLQLAALPGLARQAGETDIADLSEGFHLMATRPEVAGEGLRAAIGAMGRLNTLPGEAASDMAHLYELLQRLLEANTVARIVALQPQLVGPDRSGEDLSGLDIEVAEALAKLDGVAQALHNYQRVDLAEDKLAYLAEAIEALSRLEREFQAELPSPERNVLARVAAGWLTVTSQALQDLQGRAQLEVALRTRQVLQAGAVTLALELTNTGRSPASHISVALVPGPDGQVQAANGAARLDILPAGRSAIVEIPVSVAPSLDHVRAEFSITFDDREREGKTLEFADLVHLVRPDGGFQPLPNPYAPGTPLAPDSPLFFGREDLFQFMAENMAGLARQNILVLTGQRRMGKTSFLQQLPARLGQGYVPVYVDGQALGVDPGMAHFFYDLALAIADALGEQGIALPEPQAQDFQERPSATFERAFLPAAFEAIQGRQLLLLFDEFEELETRVASGKLEPAIFPFFRHLMQHGRQLGFIFVGTHRLEALSADYWSIFFNIALYKHVTTLDEKAARALMVQPVAGYGLRYDDLAVDKVLRMTAGHPYFLQLTCHALVNHANRERRGYLTIQDVNDVLGEMMELGEAHFAFLWEESSPAERLALAALSRLLGQEPAVTVAQVAELLGARGISLPAPEVASALERLMERDILRGLRGQPPRYDYKVGLVNLWVERHKPLGQVIEEVG